MVRSGFRFQMELVVFLLNRLLSMDSDGHTNLNIDVQVKNLWLYLLQSPENYSMLFNPSA